MESIKSPQKKVNQYHFCVRITPKVLSKHIFQSKGIQSLYKLQIDKGSKRQTFEVMKRNLHQQALEGFYRSQNCYFTLNNYTNFRPYQMKITFSQINSFQQQEAIFIYKFSTFGIVKNFLQNGVRRSTHVVTKDFETEFFIDFYVQNNKARLQDKVRSDSTKQILSKKHFKHKRDDDKDSDTFKNSVVSNNSPSKSSHRETSVTNYRLEKGINTRSSTPLVPQNGSKRRNFIDEGIDNARSQKISSRSRNHTSQTLNVSNSQTMFMKKSPSSRLSYGDYVRQDQNAFTNSTPKVSKLDQFKPNKQSTFSDKRTIKYESHPKKEKQSLKPGSQFRLKLFLSIRDISFDQISYKIKKNIIVIIFVSIIFFIVASKTFDSFTPEHKLIPKPVLLQTQNEGEFVTQNDYQVGRSIKRKRYIKQNKNLKFQKTINYQELVKKKRNFKEIKSF